MTARAFGGSPESAFGLCKTPVKLFYVPNRHQAVGQITHGHGRQAGRQDVQRERKKHLFNVVGELAVSALR